MEEPDSQERLKNKTIKHAHHIFQQKIKSYWIKRAPPPQEGSSYQWRCKLPKSLCESVNAIFHIAQKKLLDMSKEERFREGLLKTYPPLNKETLELQSAESWKSILMSLYPGHLLTAVGNGVMESPMVWCSHTFGSPSLYSPFKIANTLQTPSLMPR